MKNYSLFYLLKLLAFCLLPLGFSSCEKDSIADGKLPGESDRASRTAVCSAFSYADSVFYLRNQLTDYVVSPVTGLAGTYSSSPFGLAINSSTGAINVSKSETGLTYKVFFVQTGTRDTCARTVTIAGIDFASSVHNIAQNDTLVQPTYVGTKPPGVGKANSWQFDIGGLANTVSLRSLGIAIDPATATINLKNTVSSGLFGIIPVNGISRTVRLYYSVDDASQKALNHIDLRLTYYSKMSNVPESLRASVHSSNARVGAGSPVSSAATKDADSKPRPPDIVIVGG